jgi:hypothetical protein
VELDDLSLASEPLDWERRIVATRQNDVEHWGRASAECLDELDGSAFAAKFVEIIENEDEVARERREKRLAQNGGECLSSRSRILAI